MEINLIADFNKGFVGLHTNQPIHDKIQFRFLLNTLLSVKFDLEPYICAEGGLEGREVKLKNSRQYIVGLQKDSDISRNVSKKEREVLNYYSKFIELTFIEGTLGKTRPELLWFSNLYMNESLERYKNFCHNILYIESLNNRKENEILTLYKCFKEKYNQYISGHLYSDELLPLSEREWFIQIKQTVRANL